MAWVFIVLFVLAGLFILGPMILAFTAFWIEVWRDALEKWGIR